MLAPFETSRRCVLMRGRTKPNRSPARKKLTMRRLAGQIALVGVRTLLLASAALVAASPLLVGIDWRFDQIASFMGQCVLLTVLLGAWQCIFRRWIWAALFLLVAAFSFSWMVRVDRARFMTPDAGSDRIELRLLAMNMYSLNEQTEGVMGLIEAHQADLIILVETNDEILDAVLNDEPLASRYPYRYHQRRSGPGQIVVFSAHPLLKNRADQEHTSLASSWSYRAGYVRIEGETIRLAAVHALSPRSESSWQFGQTVFSRLGAHYQQVGDPIARGNTPTIIAGDLNGVPTNLRSRRATKELGLVRAKPLRVWDGTIPSVLPWFARIPIDDALVSPDIHVHAWRALHIPGSDHRGVLMHLSIPRSAASGPE
jgi:endonuclease/exonuclease/phosphatase (EEP) superfamily protein YafD